MKSLKNLTLILVPGLMALSFETSAQDDAVQTYLTPQDHQSQSVGEEHFTGKASMVSVFGPQGEARSYGAYVSFEPGAHTAWHEHPLGQKLLVTAGEGFTQDENGKVTKIKVGDFVICPPHVKHWHGAALDKGMIHLAIGENDGKSGAIWYEKISPEDYAKLVKSAQ